jgi:hypothetical protein
MTVDQILIALRRGAANDYPLSVSPHEALALVAEVERLREYVADFTEDYIRVTSEACAPDELHCSCVPHLRAEVVTLRGERNAVVAWLRDCALDPETTGAEMRLLQGFASCIERGDHCEHRKEKE